MMMRVLSVLWITTLLLMPQTGPQNGITVVESEAEFSFAQQVTFKLKVKADAEITHVHLLFRANNEERTAVVVDLPFEQAAEVSLTYTHDLRDQPLPPFSTVHYRWRIEDASGVTTDIKPEPFEYKDNRFTWERLTDEETGINVHWIEGQGDLSFGQAALDIAQSSLNDISTALQTSRPARIDIYIYDSAPNLEAAMSLTGRDWAVGQAHPELGVVVIAVPHKESFTSQMKRYIPHELSHLLIYQKVTPAGYTYVPDWLDEGLATNSERLPSPDLSVALERAIEEDRLIPLKDLCVPFSPYADTAHLAYAQSASVVRYIQAEYGAAGLRALLAAYENGASCNSGVKEALKIDLNHLETDWRTSLEPQAAWKVWVDKGGVWLAIWLLIVVATLPMIGGRRRHN